MTNLENLSKSEIIQLISKYKINWNVSYATYDRRKITETLEHNPFVSSIIGKISRACGNVSIMVGTTLEDEFTEQKNSPLAKIIGKPSPIMTQSELKRNASTYYHAFGECFIAFEIYENGNNRGQIIPGTLFLVSPELVDIKHNNFIPTEYIIAGDQQRTIPASKMIHIKTFNPDYQDLHGLSPIKVAGILIDKLIAANDTEVKTFQNGGPAYLVSAKEVDSFTPEEYTSMMDKLRKAWNKITNKQGIVGTSGAVDVKNLGISPVDMGTIESQKNTTKILLVLWGLDPGLFDTDASTYNNKQMMDKTIYTEAAIPFIEDLLEKFNDRFELAYNAKLVSDTSDIEALQPNYKEKVDWMTTAGVFTENEIREALGYDKREGEESGKTPRESIESDSLNGFNNDDLNKPVIE